MDAGCICQESDSHKLVGCAVADLFSEMETETSEFANLEDGLLGHVRGITAANVHKIGDLVGVMAICLVLAAASPTICCDLQWVSWHLVEPRWQSFG